MYPESDTPAHLSANWQHHSEVVELVRRYFTAPSVPAETFLAGPLLDFAILNRGKRQPGAVVRERRLRRCDLIAIDDSRAVVDVLVEFARNEHQGQVEYVSRGPVVLENSSQGWRIVDYD